ncbi:aminoglycoside phosphotransferase family protein [Legionella hackeliae]|uniref:Aminoglycoside phosphotransferase involved in cell wall biosynthesis n=1 Tax=Legionella hackeliae TaxID=449 RepID=A0A0A8UQP6_LEGHA|nr:phosphotransferase [Legionella hackeliae]KTD13574.1 putative phosphotransferase [Legionella hackeliae]CEK09422.1 Aminoglycoside phosphotransferase involved in cell wall biosynthesis [Legionella hackeliae]STX49330.1 putative phosphotransferase [Legionella hackeliae]
MQNRQNALNKWLEKTLTPTSFSISPLAGDASFRRYFRLQLDTITQVIMDAPPDKEAMQPFLAVGDLLTDLGVRIPSIHALDKAQGFAILDDFGDELLLKHLAPNTANKLYTAAMNIIQIMQRCPSINANQLPRFDKQFMLQEISNFREWFLHRYLNLQLRAQEEELLSSTFDWLTDKISNQPQVFIHRDYHSRNIMLLDNTENDIQLGIIDFQDAMLGPFTYDLVSLLKDCYIQWPRDQVMQWVTAFYEQSPLTKDISLNDFIYAFDLCGLQRHLKVLGVFSRLYLRDNKPNYLQDLPLTLHYVMACLESYKELEPFYEFMQTRIRLP